MNLNLPGVVLFCAGVVLMYSAVKNKAPQDLIRGALSSGNTENFNIPVQPAVNTTPIQPLPGTPPGNVWV